jgi:putative hydrolase of the HAD superfamily
MIKNIIFDFGDIFINLDKQATYRELKKLGVPHISDEMTIIARQYEKGIISTQEFTNFFSSQLGVSVLEVIVAWNSILLNFPRERFLFLKELYESKKYRLFLLSNTNELHISWIQQNWGFNRYMEFKNCFEKFYLSHEIKLRKPNKEIYEFALKENNLIAEETLFIDDLEENTAAASALGIHVWNLIPNQEDVSQLFIKKQYLF